MWRAVQMDWGLILGIALAALVATSGIFGGLILWVVGDLRRTRKRIRSETNRLEERIGAMDARVRAIEHGRPLETQGNKNPPTS